MPDTAARPEVRKTIVMTERWRRFQRDGDRLTRDELVLAYSPLVKHIAGKICSRMPPHVDLADLISYGLGGLVDAVERFDPARGIAFESFAALRVRGAIFDELRSLDWVPRAIRAEGTEIQRASADLLVRLQRLPDDAELAAELGIDDDELAARLQRVATSRMVALDEPTKRSVAGAEHRTLLELLPDLATPDPALGDDDGDELRARAADAVQQLTGREQTILALRYHQDLYFSEIGEILQITESRVSQIHAKLLLQLRAVLA